MSWANAVQRDDPAAPPPLFAHQAQSVNFYAKHPEVFDMSDAGTGKTRVNIESIAADKSGKRTLVVCPKSIMVPAWVNDFAKFAPTVPVSVATAERRKKAFEVDSQVVVINHDGVKFLAENPKYLDGFNRLVVDESTAFKAPQSQRSRYAVRVRRDMQYVVNLSGTPSPQGVLDLWHQAYLLDKGQRLSAHFYRFRATICEPIQKPGGFIEWREKEGADEAVAQLLGDITIRHKLEECIDIPPNQIINLEVDLSPRVRKVYNEFKRHAIMELESGTVSAVNAAALLGKLLQIASGAVYGEDGEGKLVDIDRYELVSDLVEQYAPCLVAFNWRHQRDQLAAMFKKRGLRYGVIDGSVSGDDRTRVVEQFQAGKLDVVLAHPRSSSHGLTLTRGKATIWPSPIYDAELAVQFERRIYRATQTQETRTIRIMARDTVEQQAYEKLTGKVMRMTDLLGMLQ